MDKAYDALRKKGLAAAAKKASRHAAEGLVALAEDGQGAAGVCASLQAQVHKAELTAPMNPMQHLWRDSRPDDQRSNWSHAATMLA